MFINITILVGILNVNNNTINPILIAINIIPRITAINTDVLCLTTSVSFKASILGFFKLIISPIDSTIIGNKISAINNKIIDIILNLNLINIIKLPINKNGNITITDVNNFDINILYGLTGILFNMLKLLYSKDIITQVIDEVTDPIISKDNNPIGK